MIIDCILDRVGDFKFSGGTYNAHDFYFAVLKYGPIGDDITRAMDCGTDDDVRAALCDYIDANEYNDAIKDYVRAVNWIDPTAFADEFQAVMHFELALRDQHAAAGLVY